MRHHRLTNGFNLRMADRIDPAWVAEHEPRGEEFSEAVDMLHRLALAIQRQRTNLGDKAMRHKLYRGARVT